MKKLIRITLAALFLQESGSSYEKADKDNISRTVSAGVRF